MLSNRTKRLLSVSLFILLLGYAINPALAANVSAQLRFYDNLHSEVSSGVLVKNDVTMTLTGLINHVVVKQRYQNPHPFAVNARYVFPLPDESAVHALQMQIGERVITGNIALKQQAEQQFKEAQQQGKRAALVRQQRANIFATDVANIGAGDEIEITLQYQEIIGFRDGVFSLRFPTMITPRYEPKTAQLKPHTSENPEPNSSSMLNQSALASAWLKPVYQSTNSQQVDAHLNLAINIDIGLELSDINANLSGMQIDNPHFGRYILALNRDVPMTRDFELTFKPLDKESSQAAFFKEVVNGEEYGLLMLVPPADHFTAQARLPREMVFVVDTSGSMHGQSMEQAKHALFYALSLLDENDSFNIIGFDNDVTALSESAMIANDFNIRRAERFIYGLQADGGTEISNALSRVLDGKQHDGFVRQIVFLTDGSVGNETQLFSQIQADLGDSRLFTVGIGSAPNSFFMTRAADIGRGTFTFISSASQVQPKMQLLFDKLAHPVVTELVLHADNQELEYWPSPLPDLYFSEPVLVAVKLAGNQHVTLTGQTLSGPLNINLSANHAAQGEGIARLWARQKIKSLLLYNDKDSVKSEVETLALQHHLLSPFTAFIAVDNVAGNEIAERSVQLRNRLPSGMTLPQTDGQSRVFIVFGLLLVSLAWLWQWRR
ncbi:marine proteobacterial sortase target protein [Pseudoalteromonas sp. JSTW]|uniref:marine proteobacterial sortase target protein n=1 Tax=Pseudoalteromonas sp. JSTW TaxID=2752475 RepID=UPI0015D537D4|nr:marine proteobacterial sortase target protein [Pseudoalteromonas sp. JSTW]QLJ08958.1 marine proteobacterial sortase target protein [Pseudoalteromonas sp. JSTW]